MPIALPLLAAGAVVAMLTRRAVAAQPSQPQPQPPPPSAAVASPPPGPPPGPPPSPLAVFVEFLQAQRTPPDMVIWCASAEAEMNGNTALARQIADRFPEAMARRTSPAGGGAASPGAPAAVPPAAADAAAAAPTIAHTMAPLPAVGSPIDGVSDEQWRGLCERLVRGDATYNSERRIGRYHQRKDRLREIGFDPESLLGAPEAQDDAFSADMADTYRHLAASGELAKHIGRPISIPDAPDGIPITLSGLFGVASVAGLEDMMEWLGSKADRKKFPHTTAAFVRANGIF